MGLQLRSYQREAIDDLRRRWDAGSTCVPIVCATGLGKSVIASNAAKEWLDANPGKRILAIAHTVELVDQMAKHMRNANPGRRVGVVMGDRNNATAEIVIASRQTLGRSETRRRQLRNVGMIIVDECHFAVADGEYGVILRHFGALPDCDHDDIIEGAGCWTCRNTGFTQGEAQVKVVGFTATLSRSDKKKLSSIWEECTFSRDIMFGIRNGFLMDVRGERVVVDELDMRNVRTRGGDYDAGSLGEELERSFAVEAVAKEYTRLAGARKGLAFWPLVATAQHAADVFNEAGIPSAAVWGEMDKRERRRILAAHRAGEIQVVHNAMALTVGYDDPSVDVIVIGRQTKSRNLYIQMAGRGLRPPEDEFGHPVDTRTLKQTALLIDVTGASENADLSLFIDLSPERSLQGTYDLHPDATLSELEEFFAEQIEEEIGEQRAGASFTFDSDEYRGATTTAAFDPLARGRVWGKTLGGTYYVKSTVHEKADSYTFIVESMTGDPGTYDIVQCAEAGEYDARRNAIVPRWARGTEHVELSLELALSWGEELAGDAFSSRKAAWRGRAASEKMRALARRNGVDPDDPALARAGELSEAIDQAIASRRIDLLVDQVRSSVQ